MKTTTSRVEVRTLAAVAALVATCCSVSACKGKEAENMDKQPPPPAANAKKVMKSPIAGSWYTADGAALRREIQGFLDKADVAAAARLPGRFIGVISPHAGYRYSGGVAAHGYKVLAGRKVRRVVVIAPTHHVGFSGLALTDATHWETPLGEVAVDVDAVRKLAENKAFSFRSDAWTREHSLDIQIPFLQLIAPGAVLVPVIAGRLTPDQVREAGRAIRGLWDEGTVVVASSDFTHYGPNYGYTGPATDRISAKDAPVKLKALADRAFEGISALDFEAFQAHLDRTDDTICGHAPISVLLAAVPKRAEAAPLRFDTSGAITGDYENSVSYFSIGFSMRTALTEFKGVTAVDPADEKFLLALARDTVRRHLAGKSLPDPDVKTLSDKVKKDFGVFVTLKKHGDLRGCIGSILPEEPLYKGVIRNAVNAATEDPRFRPMTLEEEPEVEIEVSVLTPPRTVDGPEDILVGRDGVIIGKSGRRAVFLPQVAPEQGWDLETMLAHLSLKAGLPSTAWKSGATFQVFQAHVFHEK